MTIEYLMFEIYKFHCENNAEDPEFILVSEKNFNRLRDEFLRNFKFSWSQERELRKKEILTIKGINISFHELIKDNRILMIKKL